MLIPVQAGAVIQLRDGSGSYVAWVPSGEIVPANLIGGIFWVDDTQFNASIKQGQATVNVDPSVVNDNLNGTFTTTDPVGHAVPAYYNPAAAPPLFIGAFHIAGPLPLPDPSSLPSRLYLDDPGLVSDALNIGGGHHFWTVHPLNPTIPVEAYLDSTKTTPKFWVSYPPVRAAGPAWDAWVAWTSVDRGSPWWQGVLAAAGVASAGILAIAEAGPVAVAVTQTALKVAGQVASGASPLSIVEGVGISLAVPVLTSAVVPSLTPEVPVDVPVPAIPMVDVPPPVPAIPMVDPPTFTLAPPDTLPSPGEFVTAPPPEPTIPMVDVPPPLESPPVTPASPLPTLPPALLKTGVSWIQSAISKLLAPPAMPAPTQGTVLPAGAVSYDPMTLETVVAPPAMTLATVPPVILLASLVGLVLVGRRLLSTR